MHHKPQGTASLGWPDTVGASTLRHKIKALTFGNCASPTTNLQWPLRSGGQIDCRGAARAALTRWHVGVSEAPVGCALHARLSMNRGHMRLAGAWVALCLGVCILGRAAD